MEHVLFCYKAMARILCDNSDGTVKSMQPLAFVANGTVIGSTT